MDLSTTMIVKNADLNSPKIKNKILKYLRQRITIDAKFESITKMSDLDNIRDNDYIICPKFNGTRSWIVFFNDGSNYYAVSFPKHSIHKQVDTRIFPIGVDASRDIYNGTIMEGIFYKIEDERYLVVDEVYYLSGQNQLLKPKDDRLKYLSSNQKKFMMKDKFRIYTSQFYTTETADIIELYDKIKSDTKIQEIIFYPKIYGRPIYKYVILDSDLISDIINLAKFEMSRTHSPDVYSLTSQESGQNIGIAYIADIDTSKKCKQWFKNKKIKTLIVNCKLNIEKNRWVPLEVVESEEEI